MWACTFSALLVMVGTPFAPPAICQVNAAQSKANCEPDATRKVPYTADFRYTSVSLTVDGKTTTYNYFGTEAADSQGRTILSTAMFVRLRQGMDITGARILTR